MHTEHLMASARWVGALSLCLQLCCNTGRLGGWLHRRRTRRLRTAAAPLSAATARRAISPLCRLNFPAGARLVLAGTIQFASCIQAAKLALAADYPHIAIPQVGARACAPLCRAAPPCAALHTRVLIVLASYCGCLAP